MAKVRALNEIAARRGQTLAQLAIAWVLRDPRVTSALIGASSVEQLEDERRRARAARLHGRGARRDRPLRDRRRHQPLGALEQRAEPVSTAFFRGKRQRDRHPRHARPRAAPRPRRDGPTGSGVRRGVIAAIVRDLAPRRSLERLRPAAVDHDRSTCRRRRCRSTPRARLRGGDFMEARFHITAKRDLRNAQLAARSRLGRGPEHQHDRALADRRGERRRPARLHARPHPGRASRTSSSCSSR